MNGETFAAALRAEIEALVLRYESLVKALGRAERAGDAGEPAADPEAATLRAENQRLAARVGDLERDLAAAREHAERLGREAQAALDAAQAYEAEFTAERRFVEAGREAAGSLLGEALAGTVGRALDASSATYGALKARGLPATLVSAMKERGRSVGQASLLDRERTALEALAVAAGCELCAPAAGTRFSAATMEKASTVSDPAEEGNVLSTAMPGLRRAGAEGALVLAKVVVATG
jgi:hypothetical protein